MFRALCEQCHANASSIVQDAQCTSVLSVPSPAPRSRNSNAQIRFGTLLVPRRTALPSLRLRTELSRGIGDRLPNIDTVRGPQHDMRSMGVRSAEREDVRNEVLIPRSPYRAPLWRAGNAPGCGGRGVGYACSRRAQAIASQHRLTCGPDTSRCTAMHHVPSLSLIVHTVCGHVWTCVVCGVMMLAPCGHHRSLHATRCACIAAAQD